MLQLASARVRPFSQHKGAARPVCTRVISSRAPSTARVPQRVLRTRAAEVEEAAPVASADEEDVDDDVLDLEDADEGFRRGGDKPEFKHFLPLPKPAHLIYLKPTVAVVADVASRQSVGLKMTAGNVQLERYIVEYYARSVK